jgi:hypothetical protein
VETDGGAGGEALDARAHRGRGVARGRAELQDAERAVDDGDEVREGAAGVNADENGRGAQDDDFSPPVVAAFDGDASEAADLLSPPADSPAPDDFPPLPLPLRA